VTLPQTATVTEAARRMHTARIKRLPVVDETERLAGSSAAPACRTLTCRRTSPRSDEAIHSEIVAGVGGVSRAV
jgi:CBS-domain-containing membrane protein